MVTIEEGRVTFEDMQANQDRLLEDPDFDPRFNQLSDASLATDTDLAPNNLGILYQRQSLLDHFTTSGNRPNPIHLRNGANPPNLRRVIEQRPTRRSVS